jgi:hypothetical protein
MIDAHRGGQTRSKFQGEGMALQLFAKRVHTGGLRRFGVRGEKIIEKPACGIRIQSLHSPHVLFLEEQGFPGGDQKTELSCVAQEIPYKICNTGQYVFCIVQDDQAVPGLEERAHGFLKIPLGVQPQRGRKSRPGISPCGEAFQGNKEDAVLKSTRHRECGFHRQARFPDPANAHQGDHPGGGFGQQVLELLEFPVPSHERGEKDRKVMPGGRKGPGRRKDLAGKIRMVELEDAYRMQDIPQPVVPEAHNLKGIGESLPWESVPGQKDLSAVARLGQPGGDVDRRTEVILLLAETKIFSIC